LIGPTIDLSKSFIFQDVFNNLAGFGMYRFIKYFFIGAAIVFLLVIPGELLFQSQQLVCIFKNFTGLQCPLCGMTRASYELAHLKFLLAFRFNPMSLFLPILLILEISYDFHPSSPIKQIRKIVFVLLLTGLIGLFFIRIFH
jgi:hypothetical protein